MTNKPICKYHTDDGLACQEIDMGNGFCFWHDETFDKSGLELKDKLERYAKKGGLLRGLKLKRANLSGLNLVKRGNKTGYDLSNSDFYRANLQNAHLFNTKLENGSLMKADLREANLHCCKIANTNLLGTKLMGARIDNLNIGDRILQEQQADQALSNDNADIALDYHEQSEEIYRDLRKAAEHQGLFELAGFFTHKELIMRRYQFPKWSKHRIFSKLIDLLCGYGEKPINVIIFSLTLILFCAFCYFIFGINTSNAFVQFSINNTLEQNLSSLLNSLYFSVVTFTTLGYGDIAPIGFSRMIAACEAFIGSFTLALFVVVFVKRLTR